MTASNDGGVVNWQRIPPSESREQIRASANEMEGLVRTTLGPYGLDKLVVRPQESGEIRGFVSNDGVSIIEEFEGETNDPVATQFIQMVEAQESDYGDGTTTAAVLTAEFLRTGLDLVDNGMAPNTVIEGFSMAAQRTMEVWDNLSVSLLAEDGTYNREALARGAVTGISNGDRSLGLDAFADDVVEAVLHVADLDLVRTETMPGLSVTESELVSGGFVRKDPKREYVSLPVSGPTLFVDGDVEPRTLRADNDVSLDGGAGALRAFQDANAATCRQLADAIHGAGVTAVFASGDVDNGLAQVLGAADVVTVQQIQDWRLSFLARTTGASTLSFVRAPDELDPPAFGEATISRREGYQDKQWLKVVGADPDASKALTFVVHAGSESVAGEAERRIKDGLNAVRAAVLDPTALPVGGAAEVAAARAVRDLAPRIRGREQIAVEGFADALESVPRILASNAGLDPVDGLLALRTRQAKGHPNAGISTDRVVVDDMVERGAIESRRVKTSALVRAVEFAVSYFRIDSLVLSKDSNPLDLPRN